MGIKKMEKINTNVRKVRVPKEVIDRLFHRCYNEADNMSDYDLYYCEYKVIW